MKTSSELRKWALRGLSGSWLGAALVTLLYIAVEVVLSLILGENLSFLGSLLLIPMAWGLSVLFLDIARGWEVRTYLLFEGYKGQNLVRIWGTMFLQGLYTVLWTLLLIVPGIVKSYSYAMTPYILYDYPELSYNAAIEKSMEMMQGHKMRLFLLHLSFIGWAILSVLTCGIGFFFLLPYMYTAQGAFYEDLKL